MKIYGMDTETYSNPTNGLLSIQIATENWERYFCLDNYDDSDINIRNDICSQFNDWINTLKEKSLIYMFNMKFDISQILLFLLNHYQYVKNDDYRRRLNPGELMILESDMKMFKVSLRNKHDVAIEFSDISNYLIGVSLDTACKEWIHQSKVEIESKRFVKEVPSEQAQNYAMEDARLTYKLAMKLRESQVITNTSITIAGRSIRTFSDYLRQVWGIKFKEWSDLGAECDYEKYLRYSVRGGICQAVHKGVFNDCTHIDARSMYPTQMVKPFIPQGGIFEEKPEFDCFRLVYPSGGIVLKDEHIPYLQWRTIAMTNRYKYLEDNKPGTYVNSAWLDGSYCFWEDEWNMMERQYDFDDVDIEKEIFIRKLPNNILRPYIEELYQGKLHNTGSKRNYYKLMLNSLYGKFLSRPDGISITYEHGRREMIEDNKRSTYYLPLGSWIATGGRLDLMECMNSLDYGDVLYCDTDSCIFTGNKFPDVKIGKNLGEWGIENSEFNANIIGAKAYQEQNKDGSVITKCAGLSGTISSTLGFCELYDGATFKVLKSHRDPETLAISLLETEYTMTPDIPIMRYRL